MQQKHGLRPENVQDYPRPPALEPAGVEIVVRLGGEEIARTDRALRVLETHHAPTYYLPMEDVAPGALRPAEGSSFCEWKGRAAYFHVAGGGQVASKAAWGYPSPTADFAAILDHVAFYCASMDACLVDGIAATPQPGSFYGGWVTPNLSGIVKGGPGTRHW